MVGSARQTGGDATAIVGSCIAATVTLLDVGLHRLAVGDGARLVKRQPLLFAAHLRQTGELVPNQGLLGRAIHLHDSIRGADFTDEGAWRMALFWRCNCGRAAQTAH